MAQNLIKLRPLLRKASLPSHIRSFSTKKQFDYQAFEEDIRRERQKNKNNSKNPNFNEEDSAGPQQHQSPSKITLSPQVTRDLQLLNVPKYVSKEDLKKQYHKLAKIYHPDIVQSKNKQTADQLLTESQKKKLEDRFKEFNLAYERLMQWIIERDGQLDDDLLHHRRPGVKVNTEDGSVTYTIGKLKIEGKRSTLDRQQLLLEMIEEDMNLKEPVNMRRNLIIGWLLLGFWYFYKDFKSYYKRMSKPIEGVDYDSYRLFNNKVQQ